MAEFFLVNLLLLMRAHTRRRGSEKISLRHFCIQKTNGRESEVGFHSHHPSAMCVEQQQQEKKKGKKKKIGKFQHLIASLLIYIQLTHTFFFWQHMSCASDKWISFFPAGMDESSPRKSSEKKLNGSDFSCFVLVNGANHFFNCKSA